MTRYPPQAHYPDSELTSPSQMLEFSRALLPGCRHGVKKPPINQLIITEVVNGLLDRGVYTCFIIVIGIRQSYQRVSVL